MEEIEKENSAEARWNSVACGPCRKRRLEGREERIKRVKGVVK